MPPDHSTSTAPADKTPRHDGWQTLRRFLPYLWPSDRRDLRMRIVAAVVFILASTATQMALPYFLKWAIDAMNVTGPRVMTGAMLFVVAYAAGRFAGVAFDNLRNIVFERVGQEATRALAENVFSRLHQLSLRFHLARRTGEVTKTIERGTKSIDTMLYFMLFNIAPTVLQLASWR
jgi:ATP-binding cassette subfamily B protein